MTFLRTNISISMAYLLSTYFHCCSFPMIIINIFSFQEYSICQCIYKVVIKADQDIGSVSVPENVTWDVTGNKNLPSNALQVRHCKYSYSFLLLSAKF